MTTSEPGPEEREEQLAAVWKRMARASRRGRTDQYAELRREHDRLKAEHVTKVHEEQRAAARARVAARRAQEAREGPKPWRLPRGFGRSPLAQQRDRSGVRPREEPRGPEGGLNPWRRGSSMTEQIWRP